MRARGAGSGDGRRQVGAIGEPMLRAAVGPRLGGHLSLWVSGNWRLTFVFDGEDVILLDYQDYH